MDVGIIALSAFRVDLVDAAAAGAAREMLAVFPAALILAMLVDAGGSTARGLLGLLGWVLGELPSGGVGRAVVAVCFVGAPRDADDGVVKAKGAQ